MTLTQNYQLFISNNVANLLG